MKPDSQIPETFGLPSRVEEYQLERKLGEGGMGTVWLALDTNLKRRVAIKFIRQAQPSEESRKRFLLEARAIARMSHPNVVVVHRFGEVAGHVYLVSEHLEGQSLDKLPAPVGRELGEKLALGLARGLAAIHSRGMLHRDLKPANLFLTGEGEIKVLDFGLARIFGEPDPAPSRSPSAPPVELDQRVELTVSLYATRYSGSGSIQGTPLYLAPEGWEGRPATTQADVYSLGATLYHLLSGRPPHQLPGGSNPESFRTLAREVCDQDVTPLRKVRPEVPEALARIVDRCLKRLPGERFKSGVEVLEAVEKSIVQPAKPSAGKRRFATALALGMGVIALFGLLRYRDSAVREVRSTLAALDTARPPSSGLLPLSDRLVLDELVSRLGDILDPELHQKGVMGGQAWTLSQVLLASEGRPSINPAALSAHLISQAGPDCACWRKFQSGDYPPHVAVSAWVILALARLGQPVEADVVEFMLSNQKAEGWWPVYPSGPSPENASTYSTALSVVALHEQLSTGKLDGRVVERVRGAVGRGLAWLESARVPGRPRWRDYPASSLSQESVAISGLALHVLHHCGQKDLSEIDRLWLRNLPPDVLSPVAFEASNKTILDESGMPIQTDDLRHYPLPWVLMATADSYPSGGVRERARALAWVERTLGSFDPPEEKLAPLKEAPWIAAELLAALRYIAGESVLGARAK